MQQFLLSVPPGMSTCLINLFTSRYIFYHFFFTASHHVGFYSGVRRSSSVITGGIAVPLLKAVKFNVTEMISSCEVFLLGLL